MHDAGHHAVDGGGRHVAIAEWGTLCDHLEAFCDGGEFTVDAGRATCEFANARLTVTDAGTVEAGMPLHAFEGGGLDSLVFHHERGEVVVVAGDGDSRLRYTFRRP